MYPKGPELQEHTHQHMKEAAGMAIKEFSHAVVPSNEDKS
jgi:hypothetical protein